MSWRQRICTGRRLANLAAALGAVLVCVWAAVGFHDGVLFGIAIGTAVAVAVLGDSPGRCAPRIGRRRG